MSVRLSSRLIPLVLAALNGETLLCQAQLIAGGAGGIAQAGAFVTTGNPAENDTFVLKSATGAFTETYTFKDAPAGDSQVATGVDAATALGNLAAAITAKGGAHCAAAVSAALGSIAATVMTVNRLVASDASLRAYGTAPIQYVAFGTTRYEADSAALTAFPTTDGGAADGTFGFARAFASVLANESHKLRVEDSSFTWDSDAQAWTAVSVALASDPGLEYSSGALRAKVKAAAGMERTTDGIAIKAPSGGVKFDGGGALQGCIEGVTSASQAAPTVGDGAATSLALDFTPVSGTVPKVFIDNIGPFIPANGDGERTSAPCYFSSVASAGAAARAWSAIVSTDVLYINGSILPGGELQAATRLVVIALKFA